MSDKTLIIRMSEELHRAFKAKCAMDGQNMNGVLIAYIESYVKESKPKKK